MAKFKLADTGFQMLPEGVHIFKVVDVKYDEDFGKMEITLQTKAGLKHVERFGLITQSGEMNEKALKAFSFFAKTCLNNFGIDEIDEQDLIGCYIQATVNHVESDTVNEKTGKPYVNVQLADKYPADGFKGGKTKDEETDEKFDKMMDDEELDEDDDLDFLDQ